MTTYVNPYTGSTISPTQVSYESISISSNTTLDWPVNGNSGNIVANIIEVTATAINLQLAMPSAAQVSSGQSVLIKNIGSNPFTVVDYSGNTLVVVNSGVAQYIYVKDNSTNNGIWGIVQFGAGTSSANASVLAGYGMQAASTTLNTISPITTVSSNFLITGIAQSSFYVWTGGIGTITLPAANTVSLGWYVIVKNDGTGILTIALNGSNTIDGNANAQLQIGESFVIVSNTSSWYSYAYGRSSTFAYTQLVISTTGGTTTLTNTQASNTIQQYQGALVSNATIILPSTVQLYSFQNNTTGSYSLTFQTAAAAGSISLAQGQTVIAICDGTNVYNSQTSTSSTINALTLGNGSYAAPSLSFASDSTSGLYLAASHQLGFAISGVNAGTLTSSGLLLPVGINGGAF